MYYAFMFFLGAVFFAVGHLLWEVMTGQQHARLVRDLDEYKARSENEKLIREFFENGLPEWGRREIWRRMNWLWKETRGWVFDAPGLVRLSALGVFALLYCCIWFKTLLFPNSQDLRLLLGGRIWILHIAQSQQKD